MAGKGDINKVHIQPDLNVDWRVLNFESATKKAGKFIKLKSKDFLDEGVYPVVDQGDEKISGFVNDPDTIYQGNIPIVIFGDHTRNIKFIDFPFAVGADGTKILDPKEFYNPKFFYYYLRSLAIPNFGYSRHYKVLKEIDYPLPPRPEQDRIVAKLDKLFEQLEVINNSLEKIPVILKNFRQQVLTQAVTGNLTQTWREGKELRGWEETTVGEFMKEVKEKVNPQEIPNTSYVGLEHLQKNGGIISVGVSEDLKSSKSVFKSGDVLYGKLRPYLNKHDVTTFSGVCSTDILVYRNNNLDACKYFNYFLGLESTIGKLNSEAKGINLPRVSSKILNGLPITVPKEEELEEIVKRVESLFRQADAIEKLYLTIKEKIENLPQLILSKAFKGELVPQLESDGDAKELLEEVKKNKE